MQNIFCTNIMINKKSQHASAKLSMKDKEKKILEQKRIKEYKHTEILMLNYNL